MSAEFDISSGFDPSGNSSITAAQLLQMIAQAAPLLNRGGIIMQNSAPDIVNNTRFSRYIWLDSTTDPPTPKIRNVGGATWDSLVVGAGSIVNSMVNAAAAIAITKLAFGTARYIVRTNAAGNALEFVNPNAIFTTNDVGLSAVDSSGAPAGISYLQRNASSGITSFKAIAFADFAAGDVIGINRIQASGVNNQVLATLAGSVTWDEIQDIIADNALPIAKIAAGSGTALQFIRRNSANTANEWASPILFVEQDLLDSGTLAARLPLGAATVLTIAHTLGVRPRIVFPVIRCTTDDSGTTGYVVGDEVPFQCVYDNTAANQGGRPAFCVSAWSSTQITVIGASIVALRQVLHKTTGAPATVTDANWTVKLYLYA